MNKVFGEEEKQQVASEISDGVFSCYVNLMENSFKQNILCNLFQFYQKKVEACGALFQYCQNQPFNLSDDAKKAIQEAVKQDIEKHCCNAFAEIEKMKASQQDNTETASGRAY